MFKEIKYNLLVRAALGLFSLSDMPFNQATLFNFQNRLRDHEEKTNVNLFEKVFDELTAEQLKKLKLKTNVARTDSFMIDSNIRSYGRLHLLIEVILRVYRVLSKSDKKKFSEQFLSYKESDSEHYIYRLKGSDLPHELSKITSLYYWIKLNLPRRYHSRNEYKIFLRVYDEHFKFDENEKFQMRDNSEIGSDSLQSPDDPDATYRKKRGAKYHGQVGSITETANPENDLNLITDAAVAPNNTDDSKILNDRFDKIVEKLPDLEELHFDGGYGSEDNDKAMSKAEVTPIQTAVRGQEAAAEMTIEETSPNQYEVSCPGSQRVKSKPTKRRYKVQFDEKICSSCPHSSRCPAIEQKRYRVYYFSRQDYLRKRRHRQVLKLPPERSNLRSNVEATMFEFVQQTSNHKLKVRGYFKASLFVFSKAIGINFGRIFRYMNSESAIKAAFLIFRYSKKFFRACFAHFGVIFEFSDPFLLRANKIEDCEMVELKSSF